MHQGSRCSLGKHTCCHWAGPAAGPAHCDSVQEEVPVAGLQVVSMAKSLGVLFGSRGLSGVDWEDRMQGDKDKLQKISRLPGLSAFGRAFAANGYAL